jgi:UDP-hydrolysing UDP-N-acetyl-D-glucosamine 2-epimerase
LKRIACVVTARPSWSRVRSALRACRQRGIEVHVIAAASALVWRYGRVADLIREDGYPVTEVSALAEGGAGREAALSTAMLLGQLPLALESIRPELVITIADRHETIATALAARNLGIPLLHLLGGERSGSIDDRIRDAVTALADIHCVANKEAARRVESMRDETSYPASDALVRVTGCPSVDLAREALELGPLTDERGYVVVLQHPVTEEAAQAGAQMRVTIEAVQATGLPAKWFWPGEDAGGDAMGKELRMAGLHPTRNLSGVDFLRLLLGAHCIVGNSSVAIRECAYLGVPAVDIGRRQQGRERGGNVCHVEHVTRDIAREITAHWPGRQAHDPLYGDGHAGERVADAVCEALGVVSWPEVVANV